MKQVIWNEGNFAEAVSTKCEMALVDTKTGKVRHGAVRCKDFLADAYYSEVVNKQVSLYGFTWTPGILDLTSLIAFAIRLKVGKLGYSESQAMQSLYSCFNLGGMAVFVDPDGHGSLVVSAKPWWCGAPWRISLLTLIARLSVNGKYSAKEEPERFFERMTKDPVDGEWVQGTIEPLKSMLRGSIPEKLMKVKWSDYKSSRHVHHGGGFYSTWTGNETG